MPKQQQSIDTQLQNWKRQFDRKYNDVLSNIIVDRNTCNEFQDDLAVLFRIAEEGKKQSWANLAELAIPQARLLYSVCSTCKDLALEVTQLIIVLSHKNQDITIEILQMQDKIKVKMVKIHEQLDILEREKGA